MTGADWGALIPAVIALLGAITAVLKSLAAQKTSQANTRALAEHVRINAGKPEV